MRAALLIVTLLIPVSALGQRNARAEEECYKTSSHVEARNCLTVAKVKSEKELQIAESELIAALRAWNEEANSISRSTAALKASSVRFTRMRETQCEFQASLAAGGNGATDRRLLCQVELNERRAVELRTTAKALQ